MCRYNSGVSGLVYNVSLESLPNRLVLSVLLPSRVVAEVSVLLEVRVPFVSVSLLSK